ncbi:hypothetical protein OAO17_00440 [Candidatus Pelagibacter sp.]|nr:hypothetical protein [Candidatus Pelagibacter sp.]
MKKKFLSTYHEILYHLIMFRIDQFTSSKLILKIDYESFMICSAVASHVNYHNLKKDNKLDWDESWVMARNKSAEQIVKSEKLSIFALSIILTMPKESVRRKLNVLTKKRILQFSKKSGVTFGDKIETFRPFGQKEVLSLSNFVKNLKKSGALDQLLELKEKDFN